MTQAEWLDASQEMEKPLRELMEIVWKMNISEPVAFAINRDWTSWTLYHEAGHKYELGVHPVSGIDVEYDGDCYFTKR